MSSAHQGEIWQWLLCATGIAEHQEMEPLTLAALQGVMASGSEENLPCPKREMRLSEERVLSIQRALEVLRGFSSLSCRAMQNDRDFVQFPRRDLLLS